jgi:hypothetical protein
MNTARLSNETNDLSTYSGGAANTHMHRRAAIFRGSALAVAAWVGASGAAFAQQTDQAKGNESAVRPNPAGGWSPVQTAGATRMPSWMETSHKELAR